MSANCADITKTNEEEISWIVSKTLQVQEHEFSAIPKQEQGESLLIGLVS